MRKEVPDKYVGREVACPRCGHDVSILPPEEGLPRLQPAQPPSDPLAEGAAAAEPLKQAKPARADEPFSSHGRGIDLSTEPTPSFQDEDRPAGPAIAISGVGEPETLDRPSLLQGGLGGNLLAGLANAFISSILILSFAVLVFGGIVLPGDFAHGLTMVFLGGAAGAIIYGLTSHIPFGLAVPATAATAMTAFMVGHIHRSMSGLYTAEAMFPTMAVSVALAAFVTGMLLLFVGSMGMGRWIRFIPHQVIGGLLAGIGVLVVLRSVSWMAGTMDCFGDMGMLLGWDACVNWLPGLGLGLALFLVSRKVRHPAALPLLFLVVLAGGAVAVHIWATPLPEAAKEGWTFAAAPFTPFWKVYTEPFLSQVRWDVVADCSGYILAVAGLVLATAMLKVSELDSETNGDYGLDTEFKHLGRTDMLCGVLGAMPVNISRSRSLGAMRTGAGGPLAALVTGLLLAGAMVYAGAALPYIPRFVPGAVLVFLGLRLVAHWLVDTWAVFTRKDDWGVLLLIAVLTVTLGALMGVAVGAALAMMILVSRYGRVDVVKFALSGANNRSNVDRAPSQLGILREKGDAIHILRLQGFIFLGTTQTIIRQLRDRINDPERHPLRYAILDFRLVNGLDSAVSNGLRKLKHLAGNNRVTLIFASLPFEVERQLEESGFTLNDPDGSSRTFMDSDFALEWCEDRILEANDALALREKSIHDILVNVFPEPGLVPEFVDQLERVAVDKGTFVFRQGDPSDSMYFIESGMVNIQLELEGHKILRLAKMRPGTIFGEMGIYTDAPRSASVLAAEDCVLYRLSQHRLDVMQEQNPHLVSVVHRFVVNRLSSRVAEANAKIRDLVK